MKFRPTLIVAVTALSLSCHSALQASESSVIHGALNSTGADPDALGMVLTKLKSNYSYVKVKAEGLTPAQTYTFTVNGTIAASEVADADGITRFVFTSKPKSSQRLLDFDPRGALLAVKAGTTELLNITLAGTNEPSALKVVETTKLDKAQGAKGRVKAKFTKNGTTKQLTIAAQEMAKGNYDVYVDGQLEDSFNLSATDYTIITLDGDLDDEEGEDSRGKVIDIVKNGNIVFSGDMEAELEDSLLIRAGEAEIILDNHTSIPDSEASVYYRVEDDGAREFAVEVDGIPNGTYSLLVGGIVRAQQTVIDEDEYTEFTFATQPGDGDMTFEFNPEGQLIEVRRGSQVFFSGTIEFLEYDDEDEIEFELPLLNTGVNLEAEGDVDYEIEGLNAEFTVEVEDLATGSYEVRLDGTLIGTIDVVGTDGYGELYLSTGDGNLSFDPLGKTLTVEQSSVIYLERTLPVLAP